MVDSSGQFMGGTCNWNGRIIGPERIKKKQEKDNLSEKLFENVCAKNRKAQSVKLLLNYI